MEREFEWITHLGRPMVLLRARRWLAFLIIAAWVIPAILAGAVLSLALTSVLRLENAMAVASMGAVAALVLGMVGYWTGLRAGRAVMLYEGGIALREAHRVRAWRWEDISAVTVAHEIQRNTVIFVVVPVTREREDYRYTIHDSSGGTADLDGWFPDVVRVGVPLEDEVTKRVFGPLAAAFNAGRDVDFGPVGLHVARGIRVAHRQLAWRDVASVGVENGSLLIATRDGSTPTRVPLSVIRNSRVLLAMLDTMLEPTR